MAAPVLDALPEPRPVVRRGSVSPAVVALAVAVVVGVGLRWWQLGAHLYGFDEAYTAMAARRSPAGLFEYLRWHDAHPPLDYLVRAPFVRGGYDVFALRVPSALFSSMALVLFAWWMRTRGWFGVLATGLMAVSGFAVFFGREARMYALLELLGVAFAVLTDRWLRRPEPWQAVAVGGLVFLGAMDHTSMLPFSVGLLAVPLLRRDREAWRWRAGVVGGLVAWVVVWGPQFLDQRDQNAGTWVPGTSLDSVRSAIGRLVVFTSGSELLGVLALVIGLVCLARHDRALARVAVFGFVVPGLTVIGLGLANPLVIERTFTLGSWAVFPALAAIPARLATRGRAFGAVGAVLVVLLVLPSGIGVLRERWEADTFVRHLQTAVRPGDVVAISPAWWGPLAEYGVGVPAGPTTPVRVRGLDDAVAFRVGDAPATGRLWLAVRSTRRDPVPDLKRCGRPVDDGVFRVTCVETDAGAAGRA